jgi:hypothetical protein
MVSRDHVVFVAVVEKRQIHFVAFCPIFVVCCDNICACCNWLIVVLLVSSSLYLSLLLQRMSFEIGNVLKFDSEEYGEIGGLFMSNNGRQCSLHPICGKSVKVGDIVKFKSDRVNIGYQMHDAIQAVFCVIDGGNEVHRCKIGFSPSV